MNELKICAKCKEVKPLSEFRFRKNYTKYYYNAQCLICEKEYRNNNKDEGNRKQRERYHQNKEKESSKKKIFYQNNKEIVLKRTQEYYKNNKVKVLERQKEYRSKNREKRNTYLREWCKDNQKRKDYCNEYQRKRRKTDIGFNLRFKLSVRLSECINRNDCIKSQSLLNVLGCSIEELKKHLGIINNYDGKKYHIDHIIPCSIYNLTKENEILKCFNFRNLRLIKAKENFKKSNKLDMRIVQLHDINDLLPDGYTYG